MGDIRQAEPVLPAGASRYDLALFIEVTEHHEKPEDDTVLERSMHIARLVPVTAPSGLLIHRHPGLPFGTHRSGGYLTSPGQQVVQLSGGPRALLGARRTGRVRPRASCPA